MQMKSVGACARLVPLAVAAVLAPAAVAADVQRYAIVPGGQYTYLPSPEGPGIPGGEPSAFQLDFGISGFFSVAYDTETARLMDVELRLSGNEAVQENPPFEFALVTAMRVEEWLESRSFVQQPVLGPFDLYTDEEHPGLELYDLLNGTVRLEGGYDATPADGTGAHFNLNAVAVPEPATLLLACIVLMVGGGQLLKHYWPPLSKLPIHPKGSHTSGVFFWRDWFRPRTSGVRLGLGVLLIAGFPSGGLGLTQSELDMNRDLWNAEGVDDYTFFVQRSCFCSPDLTRPAWVDVRNDVITSVTDAETLQPLDPLSFPTIDDLFDELQSAIDLPAYLTEAQFHASLGYPTSINIDLEELLADDEVSYVIRDLTVVPEPTSLVLATLLGAAVVTWQFRGLASRAQASLTNDSEDRPLAVDDGLVTHWPQLVPRPTVLRRVASGGRLAKGLPSTRKRPREGVLGTTPGPWPALLAQANFNGLLTFIG